MTIKPNPQILMANMQKKKPKYKTILLFKNQAMVDEKSK